MQKSDWWQIATAALKVPFQRYKLLLRCAAVPVLFSLAAQLLIDALGPESILNRWPSESFAPLPLIATIVPWLILEWGWMNALWHGDEAQIGRFAGSPSFWRYLGLFSVVVVAGETVFHVLPQLIALSGKISDFITPNVVVDFIATPLLFLTAITAIAIFALTFWVFVRLAIWNAVVIDQRRIISPVAVWLATRGYGAQIFGVFLVTSCVTVGATLIFGYAIARFAAPTDSLPAYLAMLITYPLIVYATAVSSAASLLIFRRMGDDWSPTMERGFHSGPTVG